MSWFHNLGKKPTPYGLYEAVERLGEKDAGQIPFNEMYSKWRWLEIRKSHVRSWSGQASAEARRSLCVATLNGDGYVREAAVQALACQRHPEFVPFLLWAVRDWVMQVRVAAVKSVRHLLVPELAPAFLKHHRLITQLKRINRIDLSDFTEELHDFLLRPECAKHIYVAMESGDVSLRMFAYRLVSHTIGNNEELQNRVARDREPAVRAWFATQLERLRPDQRHIWLERMIVDRSTYVACRVIRTLDGDLKQLYRSQLIVAACSPSRSVREAARYAIDDWDRSEFANLYRNKLLISDESLAEPGVIGGLGETGSSQDSVLLTRYINSRRSRIRFEAIRGIAQLDREAASDILVDGLADTSGRVRGHIIRVLSEKLIGNEADRIYRILFNSGNEVLLQAALRAMAMQGSWEAVPSMLLAAAHESEAVRFQAGERCRAWMGKYGSSGWLKPDAKTGVNLKRALATYCERRYPVPHQHRTSWDELLKWANSVCD